VPPNIKFHDQNFDIALQIDPEVKNLAEF